MADERMSEEDLAALDGATGGTWRSGGVECVVSDIDDRDPGYGGHLIAESIFCEADKRLIAAAPRLLAELRHERARADALEAERDRLLFDAGRVLGNIAAKATRERKACAAHVRRRGVESKDGTVLGVTTDIANEIEEGLHHG